MARPTISLQAAVGAEIPAGIFTLDVSLLDGTDVLGDYFLVGQRDWAEIGDYCDTISIRRGRQRFLEQFAAGTMHAGLDNSDRRFDPTWTAGPYSDAGVSLLTTDVPVRVQLTYSSVTFDRYYGFVDDWSPAYQYPEGGRSDLLATDAFKLFTIIDPSEQSSQGAGDTTGARLNRILDLAGWGAQRDIEVGQATHSATTMAQPIISQLRLAADSERGDLYMGGDGFITHRGRFSRLTATRSKLVQWTLGDSDGELNPSSFQTTNNDELKRNDIRVARAGGTEVVRQSPEAVATPYKVRTYTRSDLTLADDAQTADYADWILNLFAEQSPRVDWVEFEPDGHDSDAMWLFILGARFGDRIAVNLTHPYDGSRWLGEYFIEGVDEDIPVLESGGKWRTRFYLADASRFPSNAFILDQSLLDGVDVLM